MSSNCNSYQHCCYCKGKRYQNRLCCYHVQKTFVFDVGIGPYCISFFLSFFFRFRLGGIGDSTITFGVIILGSFRPCHSHQHHRWSSVIFAIITCHICCYRRRHYHHHHPPSVIITHCLSHRLHSTLPSPLPPSYLSNGRRAVNSVYTGVEMIYNCRVRKLSCL